jgi:hypothetical protein
MRPLSIIFILLFGFFRWDYLQTDSFKFCSVADISTVVVFYVGSVVGIMVYTALVFCTAFFLSATNFVYHIYAADF